MTTADVTAKVLNIVDQLPMLNAGSFMYTSPEGRFFSQGATAREILMDLVRYAHKEGWFSGYADGLEDPSPTVPNDPPAGNE